MFLFIFLLCALLVLTFVYINGKYNERYWKKRGVPFHPHNKVMGPFWDFITGNRAFFIIIHDLYKLYPNEHAVAFGSFLTPSVYVKDPKNVQFVMQSPLFIDRGFNYNKEDLLADNVLFMNGIRWKLMRQKMTPLFTSSKLKNMYYIIDKSAQDFVKFLLENPNKLRGKNGDTFETLSTFCCAAVTAAVFGIGTKSTFESPFLDVAKRAFKPSLFNNIRFSLSLICPALFKMFNIKLFKEFEEFFIGAIKQVLRQRKKEGNNKHDFADICISIQKNGAMKHDETGFEMQPTDELLAAQGFFFFIAGVEPTATGVFGALIEIGKRPEIQKRLQDEVDDIFEKYNGQLSYEAVTEMEYLEKVLCESLRVYPPIGYLTRRCAEDTVLPDGNIKIEKGTKVYTPIYEYHHDPQYFKDPEVFDPERFSDAKQNYGVTYMPFGYGNRICIGARYARLQVKSGLAHLLRNFNVNTVVHKGGLNYRKEQVQVRMKNVDIEYVPRKIKST